MSLIADTLLTYLPGKRKHTPSGWIGFNAVCCDDKRQRGGFIVNGGDAVSYIALIVDSNVVGNLADISVKR